jgi:hypothetical protein
VFGQFIGIGLVIIAPHIKYPARHQYHAFQGCIAAVGDIAVARGGAEPRGHLHAGMGGIMLGGCRGFRLRVILTSYQADAQYPSGQHFFHDSNILYPAGKYNPVEAIVLKNMNTLYTIACIPPGKC